MVADSGTTLASGVLVLHSVPPGTVTDFAWSAQLPDLVQLAAAALQSAAAARTAPLRAWVLELRTTTAAATAWCDAGHEVALTQIPLPPPAADFVLPAAVPRAVTPSAAAPPLRVLDAGGELLQVQAADGRAATLLNCLTHPILPNYPTTAAGAGGGLQGAAHSATSHLNLSRLRRCDHAI